MRLLNNSSLSARFTTTLLLLVIFLFFFNFNFDVFKAGAQSTQITGNGNVGYIVKFVDTLTLTVSFSASPGTVNLGTPTNLGVVVDGSVTGTINYNIWWDCSYNTG